MNLTKSFFAIGLCNLMTVTILGCGNHSSGSDSDNNQSNQTSGTQVTWASVDKSYNPNIESKSISTQYISRINIDEFGFADDVHVIYSQTQKAGTATLQTYTVFKNSASFGSEEESTSATTLKIERVGSYSCSIHIENGAIKDLDGGCIVRIELILPAGASIEVYNLDKLLTPRYMTVSNAELTSNIHAQYSTDKKLACIDSYLTSYSDLRQQPQISCADLRTILQQFDFGQDKLEALRKLYPYVSDRSEMADVIDQEFSYFDRQKAHEIIGY